MKYIIQQNKQHLHLSNTVTCTLSHNKNNNTEKYRIVHELSDKIDKIYQHKPK